MNTFELIKQMMQGMRSQVNMTMKDVTFDQFNWASPGTCNTISATFIHMTASEDYFVQDVLQGKPHVWDAGNWCEKTWVKKTPGIGENWDEFKRSTLPLVPFFEYQKAVWAATDAYIAGLTTQELERKVKFAGGTRTVGDMLVLAAAQELAHSGEIAALKGAQGVKGLPI